MPPKETFHLIGSYTLGMERVDLFVDPELNGAYYSPCPMEGRTWIRVGYNYSNLGTWETVIASIFHEAFELAASRMRLKWSDVMRESHSAANYLFVMTHEQFEEVMACTASYFAQCENDLWKHFQQSHKKKPVKKPVKKAKGKKK